MLHTVSALFKETLREWREDQGPRLGAALAYYAIFSIPPMLMISLAVLGLIYSTDISHRLQTQLALLIDEESAKSLLSAIEMKGQKGGIIASIIGVAVLFFGASGVFAELQDALNTIWGVKPKAEGLKGLLRGRFSSFTMVLGICFLLLVSLIVSALVSAMSDQLRIWLPGGEAIGHLLEVSASVIVITALFGMIFKMLPDAEIRWRDVWVGALVTSILFSIGKFVIGMYIGKAGIGTGYGAAGSIVILITWVYYSAQLLYFGAEFTQVHAKHRGTPLIPKAGAVSAKT
jgi:membrane protein